jgi:WD40 repeat protein
LTWTKEESGLATRVWDPRAASPLYEWLGENYAYDLTASPDGELLYVAETQGRIRPHRIGEHGSLPLFALGEEHLIIVVAHSPRADLLAVVSATDEWARHWLHLINTVTGEPLRPALELPFPGKAAIGGLAFSPDGSRLAAVVGSRVRAKAAAPNLLLLWRVADGHEQARKSLAAKPNDIDFHPGGTQLVVGTNGGQLLLFDAQSGDVQGQLSTEGTGFGEFPGAMKRAMGSVIKAGAFTPDGSQLYTLGEDFGKRHSNLAIWDTATRERLRLITKLSLSHTIEISSDGKLFALIAADETLQIWRTQ